MVRVTSAHKYLNEWLKTESRRKADFNGSRIGQHMPTAYGKNKWFEILSKI